ncbi:Protoheme IX farnesyltransferase, mitochondrial [Porphyridium purpureum]|uniref:Heme O synthase n=1 Tax=Porphyridium purpureum TaxID=35688 RepID=A0A5J4YLN0_PORPP|nr:Protoheme IX farnesyltransferase, mitochondrial [Porphyridium purpureum]|eukprot:POR2680..scf295_9
MSMIRRAARGVPWDTPGGLQRGFQVPRHGPRSHLQRALTQGVGRCAPAAATEAAQSGAAALGLRWSGGCSRKEAGQSVSAMVAHAMRAVKELSKYKLSALVTFTAGVGFAVRCDLSDGVDVRIERSCDCLYCRVKARTKILLVTAKQEFPHAAQLLGGTFLAAAAANTLNQMYEVRSDAKMVRTRLRPLPSGRIGLLHAGAFALVSGVSSVALLYYSSGKECAALGLANIFLYAGVYTPLKAIHPVNTFVGAIVGAIPPLMGWCAAAYHASGSKSDLIHGQLGKPGVIARPFESIREHGALILAGVLTLWQIPHFHALAFLLRQDYAAGGIRMLAVSSPVLNARLSLACAALMLPWGFLAEKSGMVSSPFGVCSLALNAWLVYAASRFCMRPHDVMRARILFHSSITYLPLVLLLLVGLRRLENDAVALGAQIRIPQRIQNSSGDHFRALEPRGLTFVENGLQVEYVMPLYADVSHVPFPFLPLPAAPVAVVERPVRANARA